MQIAASGGVKNDHVNPSGDTKKGLENVPFSRDEYTAEKITLYVNLDLAPDSRLRIGRSPTRLLVLLALFKLRALRSGSLRSVQTCDLRVTDGDAVRASNLDFELPALEQLSAAVQQSCRRCRDRMVQMTVRYEDGTGFIQ